MEDEIDIDTDDQGQRQTLSKEEKLKQIEDTLKNIENGALELYKSTGRSPVWKKFLLIRDVQTKKRVEFTQCIECKTLLTFKENSGSSHLIRHKCHIDECVPDAASKYRELVPAMARQVQNLLVRNMMEYCADELVTWEKMCESPKFVKYAQSFISLAQKHGNVCLKDLFPDSNTMKRAISKFKDENDREIYQNIRQALNNDWCSASLCIKEFKNSTEKSLLIMRVQFYAHDLSGLMNKAIFAVPFDRRSSEIFLRNLVNGFKHFGGDEKDLHRMKIVTPGDSIFLKTLNFPFSRRMCMVNAIIDVLNEAFDACESDELNNFLVSCRKIVKYVNDSDKYDVVLEADNGLWKDKMMMMESINSNYDDIIAVSSTDDKFTFHFNKRKSEEFVAVLSPFIEAIDDLSATTYTTANKVFVWRTVLNEHLQSLNGYSSDLKEFMIGARDGFVLAFPVTMDDKVNSFLDPRFKQLLMLTEGERSEVVNEVRNSLQETKNDTERHEAPGPSKPKKNRLESYESQKNAVKPQARVQLSNKEKGKSRLAKYEEQKSKGEETDEVTIYLKLPLVNSSHFESEFDIIKKFWVSKQKVLPKLYKLAVTRLHVPAYCGSFGTGVTSMEENLDDNILNDLLIIREHLQVRKNSLFYFMSFLFVFNTALTD